MSEQELNDFEPTYEYVNDELIQREVRTMSTTMAIVLFVATAAFWMWRKHRKDQRKAAGE